MSNTIPHDHPCMACSHLAPCSCNYPAVSTDFVCDDCHVRWTQDTGTVTHFELSTRDMETIVSIILVLEKDPTNRSLSLRFKEILDRGVTP